MLLAAACSGADRGGSNDGVIADPTSDPDPTEGLTEYGSGEYAIFLAEAPRRFCWYIEETTRICGGSGRPTRDDVFRNVCIDDELDCLANQPEDSERETSSCWTRITYDNVSRGPLFGTCDHVERYFGDDPSIECLYHRHCSDGQQCADYQCFCPPGVECACARCRAPAQPTCNGDVLVVESVGNGCTASNDCIIDTTSTDCAAQGQRCDASLAACVPATSGTDGGIPRDAGSGPDAGVRDAGCMCPPQAPPRCEGDVRVVPFCDAATCSFGDDRTDCAAQGQVCDPATVTCIDDVECRVDADCPAPGPTPVGVCVESRCEANVCVERTVAC